MKSVAFTDEGFALGLAFLVNVSITSMAVPQSPAGGRSPGGISATADGLQHHFGTAASALFACTLVASGLASATTGGMAGTDVFTHLLPAVTLPLTARRLVFLVPAAAIACSPLPQIAVMVWGQVVLSCALPLVLVPLLWFVTRADVMGATRPGRLTVVAGVTVTAVLVVASAVSLT